MSNIVAFPQQLRTEFTDNSKFGIRFDRLRPGSYFRIIAEPSRRIYKSNDARIYQRASEDDGFYSTEVGKPEHSIILMPHDLVMPMVRGKKNNQQSHPAKQAALRKAGNNG